MTLRRPEQPRSATPVDHHGIGGIGRLAPTANAPVRASLVGPRSLCTAGIVAAMAQSRFAVVLQCDSLEEFQAAAPHMTPALCLFIAQGSSVQRSTAGITVLRRFAPTLRLVAVSGSLAERDAFLSAGADLHVSNEISPEGLLMILGSVMDLPSRRGDDVEYDISSTPSSGASERLSAREIEVIAAIARGHSNKGVARQLSIAEPTVKAHVRAILRKTGVANRTQVALWLARRQQNPGSQANPAELSATLDTERRAEGRAASPLTDRIRPALGRGQATRIQPPPPPQARKPAAGKSLA